MILVGITLQVLPHARSTSVNAICELDQCTMHIVFFVVASTEITYSIALTMFWKEENGVW